MSGFDQGTLQHGVFAQTKQFGSVLRGSGPPVPAAGVLGDLYLDTQTWQLFEKRGGRTDPWGHYLFAVPVGYRNGLKWFGSSGPASSIGADGDYFLLFGGYPNYGLQPMIYGPKAAGSWPANPVAVAVALNALYTAEDTHAVP